MCMPWRVLNSSQASFVATGDPNAAAGVDGPAGGGPFVVSEGSLAPGRAQTNAVERDACDRWTNLTA